MCDPLPMLRDDLQLTPVRVEGRELVAVRDLSGLSDQLVLLPPEVMALLPFYDGRHTRADLQAALSRAAGGLLVEEAQVKQITSQLDELGLLMTADHLARLEAERERWRALPCRPPALAGEAYPAEPDALRALLDEILAAGGEPPPIPAALRAVIAPHIDLRVGRLGYARAYAPLRDRTPSRVILLGTGHGLADALFSVSDKDLQTPLGTSPVDAAAVEALREAGREAVDLDDMAHRREHALEFQALFIQHLFGCQVPLVPVLCGSIHDLLLPYDGLSDLASPRAFCHTLGALADPDSLIVAGVDLSHSGPKFGHRRTAEAMQAEFEAHDRVLLDRLCAGDGAGLWAESRRVADHYHVCGLSTLASLLCACPDLRGQRAHYEIWHEEATRSAVSFAAVHLA